jgi:hypothetical protein
MFRQCFESPRVPEIAGQPIAPENCGVDSWNGSEKKIPLESGPATAADDRVSAAEAALQVARRASGDLRGALAEAATAYREADRRDEAIAAYRELATVLGRVLSCDQGEAFVRSLSQIIEARRWRPAR